MNAYIDSSVLLRVVFGEPDRLRIWPDIATPVSSELTRVECLRTVDRARLRRGLDDDTVAQYRVGLMAALASFTLVRLGPSVLQRAAEPFPTLIGSLDAIHLASALLARSRFADLVLATHDAELGMAARAMGIDVYGDR